MTHDEALEFYLDKIDTPDGAAFAEKVGQRQEEILRQRCDDDLDEAFRLAVSEAAQ